MQRKVYTMNLSLSWFVTLKQSEEVWWGYKKKKHFCGHTKNKSSQKNPSPHYLQFTTYKNRPSSTKKRKIGEKNGVHNAKLRGIVNNITQERDGGENAGEKGY